MYYRMNVAGLERDLPICPVNDKLYNAGFVIFGDQELTVACARELLKRAPEYDYIITAEAKGIPLAHEMPVRQATPSTSWPGKAPSCICGISSPLPSIPSPPPRSRSCTWTVPMPH